MFKKITFVFLAVLLFGGSALAFAWWDNLTEDLEDQTLELGVGVRLTVEDETTEGQGLLVPVGSFYAGETGYTTVYTFTYDLVLEEALAAGFTVDLTVVIDELAITGGTYRSDVFTISINGEEGLSRTFSNQFDDTNAPFTVVITVALKNHPDASLQGFYDDVAGKPLTFNVSFEIE